MLQPADIPLSPLYYRDNFLRLCDTVLERYGDLLDAPEHAFLDLLGRVPVDAQCLYVRLVSRVGPWFREAKLSYPEIGDLRRALDSLLASGLAREAQALSTADLAQLYTRDELRRMFAPELGGATFARKGELLDAIDGVLRERGELPAGCHALERGRIVAPVAADIVARLQVLFFGNRRQSLTEFVLEELGVTRYYPYRLDREQRLFTCRAALDEYLALAAMSDLYREMTEQATLEPLPAFAQQLAAVEVQYASSGRRWSRLCNAVARDLERLGEDELALALYERSGAHPARERRARVLERRQDWRGASALCREILADPWCEAEAEAAGRILPRLSRKLGEKPAPRRRDAFEQVQLALPRAGGGSGPGLSVERLAASHLEGEWASVHYVENSLMKALFGLAFWEQIFAPVPGAFHNAFQGAPADMYDPAFREARREALSARLRELAAADLGEELVGAFHRYQGFRCHWLDWRYLDETLLRECLAVMPADHVLAILERMLFDPRENRRGFPDLLALGQQRGDYRLIEVKGPGDALQDSQKRWLRFFQAHGIPAQVAWVNWAEG